MALTQELRSLVGVRPVTSWNIRWPQIHKIGDGLWTAPHAHTKVVSAPNSRSSRATHPTAVLELSDGARANGSPRLMYSDSSPQRSWIPGPNICTELLGQTMLHRLLPRIRERAPRRTCRVDWVTGAALYTP
jgi:hypothetical protein